MRKSLLLTSLLAPLAPLAVAAPAHAAAANTICVDTTDPACTQTVATISAGIAAANSAPGSDLILVGAGNYTDGPYQLIGQVTIQGAGQGDTMLTLPAGGQQIYVLASNGAAVQDLSIDMAGATSTGDQGLVVGSGSRAEQVTVTGAAVGNATGVHLSGGTLDSSVVDLALTGGNRGIYTEGSDTITDSVIAADQAVGGGPAGATISRSTLRAGSAGGVSLDVGSIAIDDTVIDLGTSNGAAVQTANFNNSFDPIAATLDHVTVVGGGDSSEGVWAYAATAGAKQTSTVQVTNSVFDGPTTDFLVSAGNNGAQGGNSKAQIDVSYTDFHTKTEVIGANGSGGVVAGAGNLDVDPAFFDAAAGNYHPTAGSPVVDQGDPAAGGPAFDRDGADRVLDGDGDGTAVRDMGAYELGDTVAPVTQITSGPNGPTNDATPTFAFSSEPGATYECQVDGGPFAACSGPGDTHTTAALSDGQHTFGVRATDTFGNTDATPATRSFTVDTVAPETKLKSVPGMRVTSGTVKFRFASPGGGATFACKLDRRPWHSCTSPAAVQVQVGRHRFSVRATDAAGNVDTSPATYRFRRVPNA